MHQHEFIANVFFLNAMMTISRSAKTNSFFMDLTTDDKKYILSRNFDLSDLTVFFPAKGSVQVINQQVEN